MTDLRYPASVSENIVRALRKVAEGYPPPSSLMTPMDVSACITASFLCALADELEAGRETDNDPG